MIDVAPVIAKHLQNAHNYNGSGRQFIEGPNNANPWGPRQGIPNASYCDSAASIVPYDAGYRWWPESQCGEKGCAYTVFHVQVGQAHAEVRFELPGNPCDVEAGDLLFYDWSGGKGSASIVDHVDTAVDRRVGAGRTHNVGYNTGSPGGCYDLWRDRKYLVCRLRPLRNGGYGTGAAPVPEEDDMNKPQEDALHRVDEGVGLMLPAVGRLEVDMGVVKAVLKAGVAGAPIDVDVISKDILDKLSGRLEQ